MSITMFAFYAACTAILLVVLATMVIPLLWPSISRSRAPDGAAAQMSVYRDHLRELQTELDDGRLSAGQFAAARRELEMRLGEEMPANPSSARTTSARRIPTLWIAAALIVAVPAAAWWLYARLGAPAAITSSTVAAPSPVAPAAGNTAPLPSMDSLAQRLALKLRTQNPDDGEGWALLARSYVELKRYREAADAFAQAAKRIPNDATLLADYADALGMANGRTLKGEPAALAQRALKADPNHAKALALAASAAYEDKNYKQAIAYWRKLEAALPAGSDERRGVGANLAEAEALLAGKPMPSAPATKTAPTADTAGAEAISGTVRVAPALASRVAAGDTLLVYAKAISGPPMPLAIVRAPVGELPVSFRLDDKQAMLPEVRLSNASEVVLTARISHTGGATPQPGDLEGAMQPVRVGATGLDLVIDQIVR